MIEFKNPFESNSTSSEKAVHPQGALSSQGFIEGLVQDFISLTRQPRVFLKSTLTYFPIGKALAYGVLCRWFGTAGQHLLFNLGIGSRSPFYQFLEQSFQAKASEWGIIRVAADPILSIVIIAWVAVTIYIASKILVSHKEVHLKSAIKISALSMMSGAFFIIPWVGELIAGVYGILVLVFGIQELYQISLIRSIIVMVVSSLLGTLVVLGTVLTIVPVLLF